MTSPRASLITGGSRASELHNADFSFDGAIINERMTTRQLLTVLNTLDSTRRDDDAAATDFKDIVQRELTSLRALVKELEDKQYVKHTPHHPYIRNA